MADAIADRHRRAKEDAATRAIDRIESGMVIGLGTGSTANHAIAELGRRLEKGSLRDVVGVSTSRATEACARSSGVPLTDLEDHPTLDLTIDGADEVDPAGDMIKGHGGALLREKIVASCSRRLIIVIDESKLVKVLGETRAVPLEVAQFGWSTHFDALRAMGAVPTRRLTTEGEPYRTDGGHFIIDATFEGGLAAPRDVDEMMHARPGVLETGLFLGFSPDIIVGRA